MHHHLQHILVALSVLTGIPAAGMTGTVQPTDAAAHSKATPVLAWTVADDPLAFRYEFLEGARTTILHWAEPDAGTWNHHTMMTFHGGVLYASWDQHARDENGPGQHGLMRRSADMGRTWTPAEELFPPLARKVPASAPYPHTRFQSNNGFAVVDGVLYAVTDVADWTVAGQQKGRPRIKVGRMARAIHPDGGLGDIFWLLGEAPQPVPGFPAIPAGDPALVARINEYLALPGNQPQLQFGGRAQPVTDDGHGTGEPVSWQLKDGTWVRIFRDTGHKGARTLRESEASKSRRNYAAFSFDDGGTWTAPTRTSFPDACGRSSAGVLPDGQVYVINAAWPMPNKQGGRTLQAISLSRDGLEFDRMAVIQFMPPPARHPGRSKAAGFQAHSVVAGDYLFVLSSVNKEDIQLKRIPLGALPP